MSDHPSPPSANPAASPGQQPDRIDTSSPQATQEWARKLDTTAEQLKDAVNRAGDRATDVEMYLKGTRSTTNTDRVEELR